MEKTNQRTQPRIPGWIKTSFAIVVSALILYYYFWDQDWQKLYEATISVNLPLAILSILVPQLIFWLFEIYITERHFTWFHASFPWREFLWVRGALYLILLVNNTIGGGGILLYLHRKTQITWTKLLGIQFFRFALTAAGFAFLIIPTTLTMHYYGIFEKARINPILWWGMLIGGMILFVESWIGWHHGKFYGMTKLIVRNRDNEFWTAYKSATKKQWLLTIFWGVAQMLPMLIGFWFLAFSFGVKIPILHFIVTCLLVMMLADLPIAFAGFGTTTMAWMIFYGEFGSTESIASLTLFLPFARAAIRALIGVIALKPALKDINFLIQSPKLQNSMPPVQD